MNDIRLITSFRGKIRLKRAYLDLIDCINFIALYSWIVEIDQDN